MSIYSKDTQEIQALLGIARSYHDAGLNLIPLKTNGTKAPRPYHWDHKTKYNWPDYWWVNDPSGIGILTGSTSGHLEVIDFDREAKTIFPAWLNEVSRLSPGLLHTLPMVATPKPGYHVYYRCEQSAASTRLALTDKYRVWSDQRQDWTEKQEVLVETKGQGGLVVAPGSPDATHPSGKPYRILHGSLTCIPVITPRRRDTLWEVARTFNRWVPPPKPKQTSSRQVCVSQGERVGDIFNSVADWPNILEPHGWSLVAVRGDTGYWRKPGSNGDEHHATTNKDGTDRLFVFSSAIPGFDAMRYYQKFAAFAILEHKGCFKSAATALANHFNSLED
jgi:hypothetical protein